MSRQGPMPIPHLRVVAASTAPAMAPAVSPCPVPAAPPPVLMGLLVCADGETALGVVREVLGWDGRHLSLRLSVDPGAQTGRTDVTVRVPLAGSPSAAGHPKAVAP